MMEDSNWDKFERMLEPSTKNPSSKPKGKYIFGVSDIQWERLKKLCKYNDVPPGDIVNKLIIKYNEEETVRILAVSANKETVIEPNEETITSDTPHNEGHSQDIL